MPPLLRRGLIDGANIARWLLLLNARPDSSLKLAEALDLRAVLEALAALRPDIERELGTAAQAVASQCWVRRAQPPHHWHQDGALHHDFSAAAPSHLPLAMLTCWIALTDCGTYAPGLEWVEPSRSRLLAPLELTDTALRSRFALAAFRRPAFAAGDALLFDGGLLHRTHVPPGIQRPRTSIELRFIAAGAPPPRLAGETLQAFA